MTSESVDTIEDIDQAKTEMGGAMSLEINAYYGVQNKIMQRKEELIGQLLKIATDKNQPKQAIKIPESPPGTNIDLNIKKAQDSFNPFWFIEMVKPKGPWDYKMLNIKYEDYGNFNYGATALAFGFQEKWALQAAGLVQVYTSKSKNDISKGEYVRGVANFSEAFHGEPYADDPKDQQQIKNGFRYYKEVYLKNNPPKGLTADDIYKIGFEVLSIRYPGAEAIARSILKMMEN